MTETSRALGEAARMLDAGDEEAALGALLDAWRATKAPQIAELVDAIGTRLEHAIAPSAGKGVQVVRLVGVGKLAIAPGFTGKREELHGIWMAIARERRPADWPRLVREIVLTADRFGVAVIQALTERAKAIGEWPPDPRTTALVIEHLRRPGYESSSSSTYPFWMALCDVLVASGDPRAVDALAALDIGAGLRSYSDRKKARVWFTAQHAATLERLRALPAATPLDKAQLAACAKLAKAIAKRGPVSDAQIARLVREPAKPAPKTAPKPKSVARPDASATDRHLAAATTAAKDDDVAGALDELIAAWRASRSPRIAELVETVAKRVVGVALPDGSRADMQAAWLAVAAKRRAADLPVLVENITNTHFRSTDALVRVEALAKWPADPRTGLIIAKKLLGTPTFYASSTKPFWTALISLAVDHGDARTLEALEALGGTFAKRLRQQYTDTSSITRWFEKQVEAACTTLRARPAVIDPDPAACARVTSALGTGPGDQLLAEIATNPDDEGLRVVLGDALLQRGDPRGEFIALQMSGKDSRRADKLLAKHGRAWLGALADYALPHLVKFERGFLVEVALTPGPGEVEELAGLPVWATVKRLLLTDSEPLPDALLRDPVMRVEHLGSLARKPFHELLAWPEIPYRSLGTAFHFTKRDIDALHGAGKRLARLRALEVYDQSSVGWLWSSWLAKQIEDITFYKVTSWDELFGRLRGVRTPRIHSGAFHIDAGAPGELVAETRMPVIGTLAHIGPGTLTALRTVRPTTKTGVRTLEGHAKRIGFALDFTS